MPDGYCHVEGCDEEAGEGEAYCDRHLGTPDPDDLWNDDEGMER